MRSLAATATAPAPRQRSELAVWDLNAKLADEPAHATIARAFGRTPTTGPVEVYSGGGYYHAPGSGWTLRDEFSHYRDLGLRSFKMKIGGAPLAEDMRRVEEALRVAGGGDRLMVNASGRFDLATALAYARELAPLQLRWFEEPGDPLDYHLNCALIEAYGGPVATGENLFSAIDTLNLVRFGGMRADCDVFQMDPGLSYGLTECVRILRILESHGFDRAAAIPHDGHLINLHIVLGHWTVCVRARQLHLMRFHGVLARPPQIRPSCVRWWCRRSPSRPPRPHNRPRARRPACITARCG